MTRNRRLRRRRQRLLVGMEQLELRRVLTLPLTLSTAFEDSIAFNGPLVDTVTRKDFLLNLGYNSYYFAPQFIGPYTFNVHEIDLAIDPEIAIYDSRNGALVALNRDKSLISDDAEVTLTLTPGVRYVVAVADEPSLKMGAYELTITGSAKTISTPVVLDGFGDARANVVLEKPTDIDYLEFTSPRDTTGILTVTTSGFAPRLALFDQDGSLKAFAVGSTTFRSVRSNSVYRIAVFSNKFSAAGTTEVTIDFSETGIVVTNTLDAGPGSLRQAILDSNASLPSASTTDHQIRFAIPGTAPQTITLATPLPDITKPVKILGDSQPGSSSNPTVAIDGSALTGAEDGLRILADDVVIQRLNLHSFPGDGIEVQGHRVVVGSNYIGTDLNGLTALPNLGHGILVQNVGNSILSGNLVSGNGLSGIAIVGDDADNNQINGNVVGAQNGGTAPLPNGNHGLIITDGDSNVINDNLISGNALSGTVLEGTAVSNTLTANKIGTTSDGLAALPNRNDGVVIKSPRNKIGGTAAQRNLISGNGKTGITLSGSGASSNVIEGNFIGTNITGNAAVPNGSDGVRVFNAPRNRIGSTTDAAAGNLVSGNRGSGMSFTNPGATGNLVLGNQIGIAADGLTALGNQGSGVLLSSGATNVQIGGTNAISRNVIAANGSSGISISSTARGNRVSRNLIGVNTAGSPRGNANAGISIQGADNTIGGANATFANTIAGNPVGIVLSGASATNNSIAFNNIGSEAAALIGNGIQIANGASTNTIGPKNTIRRNLTGIRIGDGSQEIRITQNSISLNFNLGIDLLPAVGLTENDVTDVDTGANRLQNFPAFTSDAILVGVDIELSFLVTSSPLNSAYPLTVEFYSSDGDGEGVAFLGSTFYTEANQAAGVKTVSLTGAGRGLTAGVSRIVALAIDLRGNTSEFSRERNLVSGAARFSALDAQSSLALDVNADRRLDAADLSLIVNSVRTAPSNAERFKVTIPEIKFDVDRSGTIEMRDVLLVIRGIELNHLNRRPVAALNAAITANAWDESLLDLLSTDVSLALYSIAAKKLMY